MGYYAWVYLYPSIHWNFEYDYVRTDSSFDIFLLLLKEFYETSITSAYHYEIE